MRKLQFNTLGIAIGNESSSGDCVLALIQPCKRGGRSSAPLFDPPAGCPVRAAVTRGHEGPAAQRLAGLSQPSQQGSGLAGGDAPTDRMLQWRFLGEFWWNWLSIMDFNCLMLQRNGSHWSR